MSRRAFRRSRRMSRWLLFVLLGLGVFGMHTLGHPGSHEGHGLMVVASPHGEDAISPLSTLPDLDPGSVCLAVLTPLLLLLLKVMRVRVRRVREISGESALAVRWVVRPPPGAMALQLARASVLRI